MLTAGEFLGACRAPSLDFFRGTPCSDLKPLINGALNDAARGFRDAVNEGEAAAVAVGAYLATSAPGVVRFPNSGLGNAVNAQAGRYAQAVGTDSGEVLAQGLAAHPGLRGPTRVQFRMQTGTRAQLGRPKISPAAAKTRLMQWLNLP